MDKTGLGSIARGALNEAFEVELTRVLDNISDPNTDGKKKRQISITIDFTPNGKGQANIALTTKSKLQPQNPINSTLYFGKDSKGQMVCEEAIPGNIPGQQRIEDVAPKAPEGMDEETGELKPIDMRSRMTAAK